MYKRMKIEQAKYCATEIRKKVKLVAGYQIEASMSILNLLHNFNMTVTFFPVKRVGSGAG